jgi:hypothetical protein
MILGKWPTWCTILSMYLFLFLTLYMFWAHRANHQERQIVSIQPLVTVTLWRWPCCVHDTATNTEWQLPEVVLTQSVSPDDEHDVLETCWVKNKNKYIQKEFVCHVGHLPWIIARCMVNKIYIYINQSMYAEECKKIQNIITSVCLLLFPQLINHIQVFHITLSSEDHEFMIVRKTLHAATAENTW